LDAVSGAVLDRRRPGEIFQQVRWITWKLDQDGSSRIKVDVER
jgi:hypothetical protein